MIRYRLRCSEGHAFDAWFTNSETCDTDLSAGSVACPECGGTEVAKAIMAPAVAKAAPAPTPCGRPECACGCPGLDA